MSFAYACIIKRSKEPPYHEKAADDISNCLDSHMVHASCFHGYHDNSFHQNPLCNAIREGRMDLLSYGCPAPYVNNSDEKTEVGD